MGELAVHLFDVVENIADATTVDQVWNAYLRSARHAGLPYGLACYLPLVSTSPFQIVTSSMPAVWTEKYERDRLYQGCLIYARARESRSSFEWRMADWDNGDLSPAQSAWYRHNIECGLLGGLAIMDHTRGEEMMIIICGAGGELDSRDRKALYFAGTEAIIRLRELGISQPVQFALSQRERECLQWAAKGKTDKEIGLIINLSEKTVNIYIERAKAKCGVATRAQAIAFAVRLGSISA
jgi:DNA-binding CsgD family transcriptional regulator